MNLQKKKKLAEAYCIIIIKICKKETAHTPDVQFINGGAHIQSNPILQDLIPARFYRSGCTAFNLGSDFAWWKCCLPGRRQNLAWIRPSKIGLDWICVPLFANGKLNSHSFHLLTISHKIIMLDDLMPEKCLTCVWFFSADECDEHPAGSICQVFSLRLLI